MNEKERIEAGIEAGRFELLHLVETYRMDNPCPGHGRPEDGPLRKMHKNNVNGIKKARLCKKCAKCLQNSGDAMVRLCGWWCLYRFVQGNDLQTLIVPCPPATYPADSEGVKCELNTYLFAHYPTLRMLPFSTLLPP